MASSLSSLPTFSLLLLRPHPQPPPFFSLGLPSLILRLFDFESSPSWLSLATSNTSLSKCLLSQTVPSSPPPTHHALPLSVFPSNASSPGSASPLSSPTSAFSSPPESRTSPISSSIASSATSFGFPITPIQRPLLERAPGRDRLGRASERRRGSSEGFHHDWEKSAATEMRRRREEET